MQDHVKHRLASDTRGVVATEHVILIACVMVVAVLAWRTFGETIVRLISGE
jgi:hypothetical protein